MYIIEALKEVKHLREKISDLTKKIGNNSAHLENKPTEYKDPAAEIKSWQAQIHATTQRIEELLCRINMTNLLTNVTITIGKKTVTKSIAAWIYRRTGLSTFDLNAWMACTSKGLKIEIDKTEANKVYSVILNYDAKTRDLKTEEFGCEAGLIDTRLEIVNATTQLIELNDFPKPIITIG